MALQDSSSPSRSLYAIEVVTIAKKLPLDDLKDIKDSLGEAQNQQNNNKKTRSRRQFQKGSEAGRRSRIRERTASSKGKEAAAKA